MVLSKDIRGLVCVRLRGRAAFSVVVISGWGMGEGVLTPSVGVGDFVCGAVELTDERLVIIGFLSLD